MRSISKMLVIGALLFAVAPLGEMEAGEPARRSAPSRGAELSVLVVHSPSAPGEEATRRAVGTLVGLLGHFGCAVRTVDSAAYGAGELGRYDAVIYLGLRQEEAFPESLLREVRESKKPVCWMGANIEQLVTEQSLRRYGFELGEPQPEDSFMVVSYRERVLARGLTPLTSIRVREPKVCQVVAKVEDGERSIPYLVQSGDFWYFADVPVADMAVGQSYLVLCDQLHRILGQRHKQQRSALVVVAGVGPGTEAGELRRMTGFLNGSRIPYAISVAPMVRAGEKGAELRLSTQRTLVGALREAQTAGAAVIAAGFSGADEAGVEAEIDKATGELARCGLFPVAWEVSGELATGREGEELALHVSTRWEGESGGERSPGSGMLPVLIERDRYGQRVLPADLGVLRKGGKLERIVEQVRLRNLVPDPWVTAGLAPDAEVEVARMLVSDLRAMDYELVDLRGSRNYTKTPRLQVHTVEERQSVAELLPKGWDGTLMRPGEVLPERFEERGRDGREKAQLKPGEILIAYPAGKRPRQVFAFERGAAVATQGVVMRIARWATVVGLLLVGLLTLVYVLQLVLRRT